MRPHYNYLLLVDTYRRPSRRRNTYGRYRVGAKTSSEAIRLLRDAIGFGSIKVICQYDTTKETRYGRFIGYKELVRESYCSEDGSLCFMPVHHATDPYESYANAKPIRVFPKIQHTGG